jgi:hypothetical protein
MGDQHWIMLKMESMQKALFGGRRPEFWVWQPGMAKKRTEGYLRRLPFGDFGGFWEDKRHIRTFNKMFGKGSPMVKKNFCGFDYVIALNQHLALGNRLEEALPGCLINWNYTVNRTPAEAKYELALGMDGSPFIVVFFCRHGFYSEWMKRFNVNRFLFDLHGAFPDHDIIITGREWDVEMGASLQERQWLVDLTGKTDLDHLFALFRTARAFVGFPAGNGMLAQHLGTPTLLLWHNHFHQNFWTSWVDPKKRNTSDQHGIYKAVDVANFHMDEAMEWLRNTDRSQRPVRGVAAPWH